MGGISLYQLWLLRQELEYLLDVGATQADQPQAMLIQVILHHVHTALVDAERIASLKGEQLMQPMPWWQEWQRQGRGEGRMQVASDMPQHESALVWATRRTKEGQARVTRQEKVLARMHPSTQPYAAAETLLHALRHAQRLTEQHLAQLRQRA